MQTAIRSVAGLFAAALFFHVGSANAQEYPWCSQTGEGGTNCSFISEEQCRLSSRWCQRNLFYKPPPQAPRPNRKPRGRG
jgi:Protein of unknown function (DUF3551)